MRKIIFIFGLILLLSCNDDTVQAPVEDELESLSGTEWKFESMIDNKGKIRHLSEYTDLEYSIVFTNDSAFGRSGCNNYWFNYNIVGDSIFHGVFFTTEVYCEFTSEYSVALSSAKKYYATETKLILYTTDTLMTRMQFKPK